MYTHLLGLTIIPLILKPMQSFQMASKLEHRKRAKSGLYSPNFVAQLKLQLGISHLDLLGVSKGRSNGRTISGCNRTAMTREC